jgi:integrase/recombinase XerD
MGVPIMFDALFIYPKVLARHKAGPAAAERERYLVHRAGDEGIAPATLLRIAREMLVVARWMDLGHEKSVSRQDIEAAAQRWALYQQRRHRSGDDRWSRRLFVDIATDWLRFLGRLVEPSSDGGVAFAAEVEDFATHLLIECGLATTTIKSRRWHVEVFLDAACRDKGTIADITVADIDAFLDMKGKEGWCRVSVAASAGALRSFFRHAEMRGWCRVGVAAAIDAPRLFKDEGLPSGPAWADVQRLIADASGADPHDIRDRAILLLLAVYGMRSGEVRQLRIEDLDWANEVIRIERSKQRKVQYYPFVTSVGDAILQYLQYSRPRCTCRELFVTLKAPIRPLSAGAMYYVVNNRLKRLAIRVPRRGPHCLRHACASHLIAAGLSLKEFGEHLGHRSAYATRIYAKVDLAGLREVANFDLAGLV